MEATSTTSNNPPILAVKKKKKKNKKNKVKPPVDGNSSDTNALKNSSTPPPLVKAVINTATSINTQLPPTNHHHHDVTNNPKNNNNNHSINNSSVNNNNHAEDKLIHSMIEKALNSLKEKEVEIMKRKHSLISNYNFDNYLEEAKIFINELDIIKKQVKTFSERIKYIMQTNTTKNLKATIEIECKRITTNRLPIYAIRNEILTLLDKNDVIVCSCSTGNGKSTQIPQYLFENGYNSIICTQPRKLTCMTLVNRVSDELKDKTIIGSKVGEGRRRNNNNTKINFITDRGLLNEYQYDNLLSKYSVIMVDEAHERSIYTDILLSLLKDCVKRRRKLNKPLKLLITSATIDETLFSKFFDNCPVKKLEHELYPVAEYFSTSRENNICEQATRKVTEIVKNNLHQGDILVFLSSKEEILQCCKLVKKTLGKTCQIIPLHGKIENDTMNNLFNQSGMGRKIIFSTNVAETSITIPSVRIVVDSGQMKQKFYDNDKNMSIIKTISISQSCAIQRKGRVGRTSSGVCYRLYSQADYYRMKVSSEPEILRSHLGVSILQILSCGVSDIQSFKLLEMPSMDAIIKEVASLEKLLFVSEGQITEQGRMACQLQMEPTLSRMIIQARLKGVEDLMAIIVSMMSISNILFKKSQTNMLSKTLFHSDYGDLFSLLHIFQNYSKQTGKLKEDWCLENNINMHYLKLAEGSLKDIRYHIRMFKKTKDNNSQSTVSKEDLLKSSIVESHYQNLAYFDGYLPNMTKVYCIPSLNQRAFIHSSSSQSLLGNPRPFILFSELIRTDKLYMKNITPIDLEDITNFYPNLETRMITNKVKSECRVNLPSIICQILKYRNTEFIEEVETTLGHIIEIEPSDSSIKVYCDKNQRPRLISKIEEVIHTAKERARLEVIEHDIGNGLRVMIGAGCKVVGIVFPNEFTKIQVDGLPLGVNDDHLNNLFLPYQAIDFRVYPAMPNDSFASGYVIFKEFSVAMKVFQTFKETIKLTPVLCNTKSSNDSPLVRLKWSLGDNNGKCFIVLNNTNGINTHTIMNTITSDRRLSMLLGNTVKYEPIIFNKKHALLVKSIHSHIDAHYVKKMLDDRNIDYKYVQVPRKADDIDEEMIQISFLSKLQLFKSFEFIDIINFDEKKQMGEALACFSDRNAADRVVETLNCSKFMNGTLWTTCVHKETLQVPKDVTDLLQFDLDLLRNECRSKIKVITMARRDRENIKSQVIIQSTNLGHFNEDKLKVVSLLKPLSLHLSYQTIQYAFRKRRQIDDIETQNMVNISVNSSSRTIEIYGRAINKLKSKQQVLKLVQHDSKTLTISIKHLKAIIGDAGAPFKELKARYPDCDILLNVKEKQLSVEGKEADQQSIQQHVMNLMTIYEQNHNFEPSENDCPICLESMTNPFRIIGCNHEVCQDCFRYQIQNANSFVCPCCDVDISISEILLYLETKQDDTYSKALESFLLENPKSFKYCPNKCGSIGKIVDNSDIFCHHCNDKFCKDCEKKSHPGLGCEESDKTREWILNNTKACPKCTQRIEKSSGCNHMTCQHCGEHFCWLCLRGFGTADATYLHFRNSITCYLHGVPVEQRPPAVVPQRQQQQPIRVIQQQPINNIPQQPQNQQPIRVNPVPVIGQPQPQQQPINNPQQNPRPAIPIINNNQQAQQQPIPQPQNPRQGLLNCLVM